MLVARKRVRSPTFPAVSDISYFSLLSLFIPSHHLTPYLIHCRTFYMSLCKLFFFQHLLLCLKQSMKIGTRWDMKTKLLSPKHKFCRKQRIFVIYCSMNLSSNWYVHSQLIYRIKFSCMFGFLNSGHQQFITLEHCYSFYNFFSPVLHGTQR